MKHAGLRIYRTATTIIGLFFLLNACQCIGAGWSGTDDFSSDISSATHWTFTNQWIGQMAVQVTNGHASFLDSTNTIEHQRAGMIWNGKPTPAEGWTVDLIGHNTVPHGDGGSTLYLFVLDTDAFANGEFRGFGLGMGQHSTGSSFGSVWISAFDGGSTNPVVVPCTNNTLFGLRLIYYPASQTIQAWYDPTGSGTAWTQLDSLALSQMSAGMTATNTFSFCIVGDTFYGPVSEGQMWADDFKLNSNDAWHPWLWAKRVASTENPDNELAVGLALDTSANAYVTGWFDGTNDFGGVWLTNSPGGGQDIFVAKYDPAGTVQWAHRAGSTAPPGPGTHDQGRDAGRGIGVDANGNVYVTGGFFGDADFGPFIVSAPTNREFFLAKYDSAGAIQWVRQSTGGNGTSGPGLDDGIYGTALAVDAAGNSYSVGFAANVTEAGTPVLFGTMTLENTNTDGGSIFLVKYDSAGAVQWVKSLNSPDESYSTSVSLDGSGNVYVAGSFKSSVVIDATNLTNAGDKDGFIAKFNSSGVFQWARQMTGPSDASATAVSADSSGHVYAAGGFGSAPGDAITFAPSVVLTNVGSGIPGTGIGDAFLAKYDSSSGILLWARRSGGLEMDAYSGVTTDSKGSVYAAGLFGGTGFPTDFAGFNAVVAKYDSDGNLDWMQSSAGSSGALAFTNPQVDAAGNCYAAGWYQDTAVFGATVLQPQNYWNYFLAKLGSTPLTLGIFWSNSTPWLSVSGDISDQFVLEYVPALTTSNVWRSLTTNTITINPMLFPDTSGTASTRFYRARRL